MMYFKNAFLSALALLPLGCGAPEPAATDDALSAIEESQLKDKAKSRNNKFLTYYYNGYLLENQDDNIGALSSYQRAERCINSLTTKEDRARLYARKAHVYTRQFAVEKAIREMQKAVTMAEDMQDRSYWLKCSYDLAMLYSMSGRKDRANVELEKLSSWMSANNIDPSLDFYSSRLKTLIAVSPNETDSISAVFSRYLERCDRESKCPNMLLSAKVHNLLGRNKEALECLEAIKDDYRMSFERADYHKTKSEALQGLGDYKAAMREEEEYERIVERINYLSVNNDIQFLEERMDAERSERKSLAIRIVLISLVCLLLVGAAVSYLAHLRRTKEYEQEILAAKAEFDFVKDMLYSAQDVSPEVEDQLLTRLNALRPYLTPNGKTKRAPNGKEIAKLAEERNKMLESIGLLCTLTYPKFVAMLSSYGLTPEEIGLCSMYVSDYRPKELPDILGRRSIYQRNTDIREKLAGCVDGTTLPVWLKKQFEALK